MGKAADLARVRNAEIAAGLEYERKKREGGEQFAQNQTEIHNLGKNAHLGPVVGTVNYDPTTYDKDDPMAQERARRERLMGGIGQGAMGRDGTMLDERYLASNRLRADRYGNQLWAAMMGEGPSVAQEQLQSGANRSAAAMMAAAQSGSGNSAMAQQIAQSQGAGMLAGVNRDTATLRAQEIAQARGQYQGYLSGEQDFELGRARTVAELEEAQRARDDALRMQYEQLLQQAEEADREAKLRGEDSRWGIITGREQQRRQEKQANRDWYTNLGTGLVGAGMGGINTGLKVAEYRSG